MRLKPLLALTLAFFLLAGPAEAARHPADRNCLSYEARLLLGRVEAEFGPVTVLSTCRPGARVRGTGRLSRHASGNAVDFRAGARKGAIVRWLIANHKRGGTMTYSHSDHIHMDIGPHFVRLAKWSPKGVSRKKAAIRGTRTTQLKAPPPAAWSPPF
jgi:Peptidase M15